MQLSLQIAEQVIVMFVLIGVGYFCTKKGLLSLRGRTDFSNLLLLIITPCILISSYQIEYAKERTIGLAITFGLAILSHIISTGIGLLLFKKEETLRYRLNRFSVAYSNSGFMAIPLLRATIGDEGVFYGAVYMGVFYLMSWTQGLFILTEDRHKVSLKKIVTNPAIIAFAIGLVFYFCSIRLPAVIEMPINYIAQTNTAFAMLIIGSFIATADMKYAISNLTIYYVSFLRLVAAPLIVLVMMKLLGINAVITPIILISAACPVPATASFMALRYGLDAEYAAQMVAISTMFSVITIPLILVIETLL